MTIRHRITRASSRCIVVGLLTGPGCDNHCLACTFELLENDARFQCIPVEVSAVRNGALADLGIDVLIVGGGDDDDGQVYGPGQRSGLGQKGMQAIRCQVKKGLHYFGICAGAYLASRKKDSLGLCAVDIFTDKGAEVFACGIRGAVELDIEEDIDPRAREAAMQGYACRNYNPIVRFDDSAVFKELGDNSVSVLARYTEETVRDPLFHSMQAERTYKKYREEMIGAPAIVLSHYGRGRVLLMGTHPELHPTQKGKMAKAGLLNALLAFLMEDSVSVCKAVLRGGKTAASSPETQPLAKRTRRASFGGA